MSDEAEQARLAVRAYDPIIWIVQARLSAFADVLLRPFATPASAGSLWAALGPGVHAVCLRCASSQPSVPLARGTCKKPVCVSCPLCGKAFCPDGGGAGILVQE